MRVGLIADDFSVETGSGIARYAKELLNGLSNNGIYVDPIYVEPPKIPFGEAVKHCFILPYHVLKEIKEVDLVHATCPVTALSFLFIKKPTIVTYHDLISILCKNSGAAFHTKISVPSIYRTVGKYCSRIIAISTQTKSEMVTRLKIPAEKIAVINLGIDERFRPTKNLLIKSVYGKTVRRDDKDLFTIGYLGVLLMRKRVDYLINAFHRFKERHPKLNAKLVIYGGKEHEYLKLVELTNKLNMARDVEFRGFALEEELVETYNSFDVFVMPSQWEGFCLPILEAQRCGVPVVIREEAHIPQEVSKQCVKAKSEEDMADKLYQLLMDTTLREKLIKRGIEYSNQFTWDRTAKETLKVYEEVVDVRTPC